MQYTNTIAVKAQLGMTDSSYDAMISSIIDGVSASFDVYVGQSFAPVLVTEAFDGWSFKNGIVLGHVPSEVEATRKQAVITEDGNALVADVDWNFDMNPPYVLYRLSAGVSGGARWASGERNIVVVYTTRWATIPFDVELAALEESTRRFGMVNADGFDGSRIGLTQRSPETGTALGYTVDQMSPATLGVLDQYRAGLFT